jgi:Bacterial HORMA domain family 1
MSATYTSSASHTYTVADVENVVRNFRADLRMMAESSGTRTREDVDNYADDIGYFAKKKYIRYVDVTLLDGVEEIRAVRYLVQCYIEL